MGTVYQAEHTDLGKRVAIKVLAATLDGDAEATARFLREAKAALTIDSEHIAQVFDVGEDVHLGLYMVMELLKGEDLSRVLAARGTLRADVAAGVAWQACLALERAHAAGVVHRDSKPANVLLTRGDDGSVRGEDPRLRYRQAGARGPVAKPGDHPERNRRRDAALHVSGASAGARFR